MVDLLERPSDELRVLFIGLVLLHAALGRGPIYGTSAVSYQEGVLTGYEVGFGSLP